MKVLTIPRIIDFKRSTDRGKRSFITDLKRRKKISEGGGHYWISSLSSISNSFKHANALHIRTKITELVDKLEDTENQRTKDMYQRNLNILHNYEDFEIKTWRPKDGIRLLKKDKNDLVLQIKKLAIQADAHHIFEFPQRNPEKIGAIWFVAKLGGYTIEELGIFAEILRRYLKTHHPDRIIDSRYCIAIDVASKREVKFSQLESGEIERLLIPTIDEIKRML